MLGVDAGRSGCTCSCRCLFSLREGGGAEVHGCMHRRDFLGRALLAGLAGAALSPGLTIAAGAGEAPDMASALRSGTLILYFRHAATREGGNDRPFTARAEQRNLSEYGISQSRLVGARLRAQRIPLGEVLCSPFYRCTDMADLAFARHRIEPNLISLANTGRPRGRAGWLRRRLSTPPPPGGNLVLIAHVHNFQRVARLTLREGEAAIIQPMREAGFRVLARRMPEDW